MHVHLPSSLSIQTQQNKECKQNEIKHNLHLELHCMAKSYENVHDLMLVKINKKGKGMLACVVQVELSKRLDGPLDTKVQSVLHFNKNHIAGPNAKCY